MREDTKKQSAAMYRVIGQIKDPKNKSRVIGYVIMQVSDRTIHMAEERRAVDIAIQSGFQNAIVGADGGLVGTDGSLTRLPVYNTDQIIVENPRVTVLGVYPSKNGKRDYSIMDAYRREKRCTPEEALKVIEKFECTNAKIVNRDGKKVISAIMGEFTTYEVAPTQAEETKAAVQPPKSEEKKWERPASTARYLSKNWECKAMRLYTALNACKTLKGKLKTGEDISFGEVREAKRGLSGLTRRVLTQFATNKYGKKTKKHYPLTCEALEKYGNVRVVAQSGLDYMLRLTESNVKKLTGVNLSTVANMSDIMTKGELSVFINIVQALYVDCLSYSRTALAKEHLKDLATMINNKPAAQKYLQEKTGLSGESAILAAAKEACKGRIDSIAQAMFISALEIVKINKLKTPEYNAGWAAAKIIGDTSRALNSNPMKIEDEKEYGALIFQALVLVMVAK